MARSWPRTPRSLPSASVWMEKAPAFQDLVYPAGIGTRWPAWRGPGHPEGVASPRTTWPPWWMTTTWASATCCGAQWLVSPQAPAPLPGSGLAAPHFAHLPCSSTRMAASCPRGKGTSSWSILLPLACGRLARHHHQLRFRVCRYLP